MGIRFLGVGGNKNVLKLDSADDCTTLNVLTATDHLVPSLHGKQMGIKQKQWQILFSWAPKSL